VCWVAAPDGAQMELIEKVGGKAPRRRFAPAGGGTGFAHLSGPVTLYPAPVFGGRPLAAAGPQISNNARRH
jgi:hypothetical protein